MTKGALTAVERSLIHSTEEGLIRRSRGDLNASPNRLKRHLAAVKNALIHSKRRSLKARRRVSVLGPQVRLTSTKKGRTLGSFS